MKIEARFVGVPVPADLELDDGINNGKGVLHSELAAWSKLFSPRYIKRTSIGVCMMFFQRGSLLDS